MVPRHVQLVAQLPGKVDGKKNSKGDKLRPVNSLALLFTIPQVLYQYKSASGDAYRILNLSIFGSLRHDVQVGATTVSRGC
jgi:hypothetical protein